MECMNLVFDGMDIFDGSEIEVFLLDKRFKWGE